MARQCPCIILRGICLVPHRSPGHRCSNNAFITPALQERWPWILNVMPFFSLAISCPIAIMWLVTLYEHHQDILLPEELSVCLWHKLTGCVISLGSQLASLWRTSPKLKTGSGSLQTTQQISLVWHLPLCIAQESFQVSMKLCMVQEPSPRHRFCVNKAHTLSQNLTAPIQHWRTFGKERLCSSKNNLVYLHQNSFSEWNQ